MSALGRKADIGAATKHVRFTPNSDHKSGPPQNAMSALPLKADMCGAFIYVCFGPIADIRLEYWEDRWKARLENFFCFSAYCVFWKEKKPRSA
jgi:hypothetical protein